MNYGSTKKPVAEAALIAWRHSGVSTPMVGTRPLLPPPGSKPACIEGMKDTAPSADPSAAMRGEAWGSIGQDLDGVGCGGVAKCRNDGNRRVQGGPGGEYGVSHYLNRKQIAQLRIEDRSPIRVNIPP